MLKRIFRWKIHNSLTYRFEDDYVLYYRITGLNDPNKEDIVEIQGNILAYYADQNFRRRVDDFVLYLNKLNF